MHEKSRIAWTSRRQRCWGAWALSLSLGLHLAAAAAVIVAAGVGAGAGPEEFLSVEDVSLAPAKAAPVAMRVAPRQPPAAMTAPPEAEEGGEAVGKREPETGPELPSVEQESKPAVSQAQPGKEGSSLGLGMERGFFTALGDGETLRDDIRDYYLEMVERINRKWWEKASLLREPLRRDGIFELLLDRDGTIVSIGMAQGTGSAEADRLLVEVIAQSSPLPPLPSSYHLNQFLAPLRIKAPLFLFRLKG